MVSRGSGAVEADRPQRLELAGIARQEERHAIDDERVLDAA